MKIFIGSSQEARKSGLLTRVALLVEDAGHIPVRWTDTEVFPAGISTISSLHSAAKDSDGAIFIFSEDDKVWYRGGQTSQPRDNVLIEYGLFSGVLGEGKAIMCRIGEPRVASDLAGITYVGLATETITRAEVMITQWLKRLETEAQPLKPDLSRLDSPFQASGKMGLFLKGTELVAQATKRVALVAKTPIILMGARPYDESDKPISYEAVQLATYEALIKNSSEGRGPDFICVSSKASTKYELDSYRQTALPDKIRGNLKKFDELVRVPRSRMRFNWYEGPAPMTFLVSDDDFMIWFKDGDESVWITAHNETIARALYSHAGQISSPTPLKKIRQELAL